MGERYMMNFDEKKVVDKKINSTSRLDFKTWLFLHIMNVIKVEHIPVVDVDEKRTMFVRDSKKNEVYIFKDYDEYRRFYLMYLDNVDNDIIDLAILTRGSKGQIVALRGLCEHIVVKKKVNNFYNSITQEKIDEIHARGKLTPLEAVELWEANDLCIEGNKNLLSKNRCDFFEHTCHECLTEQASHELEHEKLDLKIVNEQSHIKKLVLK